MTRPSSGSVAFSPAVKEQQRLRGSRDGYARLESGPGWRTAIDADLAAFLAQQTSFFLGTASASGQPYIQHRGGPPGFLRVVDAHTLAFADYRGNRQYITTGNLTENPRVHLFLVDYARRRRIKIWGRGSRRATIPPSPPRSPRLTTTLASSRRSSSASRPGTPTARSTSRRCSMPKMWATPSSSSRPGTASWRRKLPR